MSSSESNNNAKKKNRGTSSSDPPRRNNSNNNKGNKPNKDLQQQQQQHQQNGGKGRQTDSNRPDRNNPDNGKKTKAASVQPYPPHWSLQACLDAYAAGTTAAAAAAAASLSAAVAATTTTMVCRGTLRALPSSPQNSASSFVTCDRGLYDDDILIATDLDRNRAMDGDVVFVQIIGPNHQENEPNDDDDDEDHKAPPVDMQQGLQRMTLHGEYDDEAGDLVYTTPLVEPATSTPPPPTHRPTWQEDPAQAGLWNPVVAIPRPAPRAAAAATAATLDRRRLKEQREQRQPKGRVILVCSPKPVYSEVTPSRPLQRPTRRIVGTLKVLSDGTTILLTPNNRSLPQFKCPVQATHQLIQEATHEAELKGESLLNVDQLYFKAEYEYGSWQATHKWPPCTRIQRMGTACVLEDEIQMLLVEYNVDHGDFTAPVLQNVDSAVQSGVYKETATTTGNSSASGDGSQVEGGLGWKPTPAMYKDRRDYRSQRIFTIDPTTAKDLDDALHISLLDNGSIEIGVHIADVSHFVRPGSAVDLEAQHRSTTVYLVDRTVPMLPRPLCEVACSLNENVERLAFSCVWIMNADGTLRKEDDVWYGRTVIKSCARLDYATAQNIIENKVATGESVDDMDPDLWPVGRRPTGGHTVDQVAADVRLMHQVAMARRRLRFANGALGLHGIKLTFQLDTDGQTPLLTAPYPIRDSNRLVEEFMLLANYLVAQRLITHAGGRALLRCHNDPQDDGLAELAAVAKAAIGFDIDITSSQTLHASLVRLGRECSDQLVLQCITQMLMKPMVPAKYLAAGMLQVEEWRHFALNIPYYTHFTSPIRRYPDLLVHRLLQATIDGPSAVEQFYMNEKEIHAACDHCNEKRMASKKAQERCDQVFLSLFVKSNPITNQQGVVLSVGKKSFTLFVASLGVNALLFLDEHKDMLTYASEEERDGTNRILLQQKPDATAQGDNNNRWGTLEIKIFVKLQVTVTCRDKPPVDVKLRLEGPWRGR